LRVFGETKRPPGAARKNAKRAAVIAARVPIYGIFSHYNCFSRISQITTDLHLPVVAKIEKLL
jgi:hypothetical protein